MMEYGPSSSRFNRDRDRDKQHSNSTTLTSTVPTQPRSTLVSRNRLPPSISTSSTSTTPSTSQQYSPPPRTSSLLPLPPTGPASYRSRERPQSQPNTPSSSSKLTELNGPLQQHSALSMRLPNKPSMMSGSGNVRRVNHRRSRSPSNSISTVISTTTLPVDRERSNTSRSSSIVLSSTAGGGEKDREEREREEARRIERAERFGTGLPSTSTSTSSRARLDSTRSENSPRSTPAPSTSSSSSSRPYLPPPPPSTASVSTSRPTSTGFQIPYRSRSRKRTREDQESENEGYRSRNSSRHTSPEPPSREIERERERERGVSRWDRGSFTKMNGSSSSSQSISTTANALPNGFKRIPNGETSKSNLPPLRFPLDSNSTSSEAPLPLPLPSAPSSSLHPGPSRFRLPPTTSSSLPLPPAPPSAPHSHSHSHPHSHSRRSSSHYSKGTGSATPRARSPEIPREPMSLTPRGPRQKERERERDDGYPERRRREKEEEEKGRSRSLSPREVPLSSRTRSRSRSRSISSTHHHHHHHSKSRRLRSRSRSITPPPLPKPEPVEVDVSMTPPLPPDRYPLAPPPTLPQAESTTPPRPVQSDTPPRPPLPNATLLPSRRRLPPPPPPPPPPAPVVARVEMEMKREQVEEELEEGEEKEEGEITLTTSSSSNPTIISRPISRHSSTPPLPVRQEKISTPPVVVVVEKEVLQREREEGEIDSEMDHDFLRGTIDGRPEKLELAIENGVGEMVEEDRRKEKEAEFERERLEIEERRKIEEREAEEKEKEKEIQLEKERELEKETLDMFEPLKENDDGGKHQEPQESIKETTEMDIDQPVVETPSIQPVAKSPTPPRRVSAVLPAQEVEAGLPPPVADSATSKEEDTAPHPSSTTPLDYHSPPQPISPPTKHIPSGLDEEEESISTTAPVVETEADQPLVEIDRMEEEKSVAPASPLPDREEWFKPTWEDFSVHQELMIPFLIEEFEERDQRRGEKMVELRREYKKFDRDWQGHIKRLDKLKERIQRKSGINKHSSTGAAQTPSIDSSGMPYYPEPVTPGPSALGGGRGNRRGGGGGGGGGILSNSATWGYGDAVRSEAEFLEILASLENADLRDPDVRAARTAAVVPNLAVDPSERQEIISCTFDDERYRVEDPIDTYGVRTPMETWTEAEVETYCKRYSLHPKQFGKISQELPDKTTAQCVLFYYRMKNSIDFRSLSERRGRDGRRKKTKKRPGEGKGKGSSLLSNLKGAKSTMLGNRDRDEEEDDEEDQQQQGIPPSPRNTRAPPLPNPTDSAPFVPRTSTTAATPRPLQRPLDQLFEDDNDDYTPSASKTARPTPRNPANSQLHSEGMMEAAEVLGALAHNPNEDQDDGSNSGSLRPRAAKTNRKVRMELDDDGAIEPVLSASSLSSSLNGINGDKVKPKRKPNTNSYWSAAEKSDIVRLLETHGKNWKAIGDEMGTKTAVQCKNWFTNNAKKLGLRTLVNGIGMQDDDYQDDESPAMTPNEYSPAIPNHRNSNPPTSYFPVSEAQHLPPLPSIPTAASMASKAGMHLRNMLNESTPDQEDASSAKEDWFGGGGGPNANMSDDESTSAQSSRPVTAGGRFDPRGMRDQPLPHNRIILSNGLARPSSHLPSSSQLPSFPTSLPDRRFDHFMPHHSAPASAVSQWSHSPVASPFASYGSPATPGVASAPPIADFYRRPTPPDYFNVKAAYPQAQAHSHSLPHSHSHPLNQQSHRFSAPPVATHTSPPLPSTSTFAPRLSGPSSFPPLPPPPAPLQQSWNPDSHR